MAGQNLEYNVYARVLVQLRGINGVGDYNYKLLRDDVHTQYILPEEAKGKVAACVGDVILEKSERRGRHIFEHDFTMVIHGYVKETDDTEGAALKLLSDFRIALAGDEDLNNLVTDFAYKADTGAVDNTGIVDFYMSGE